LVRRSMKLWRNSPPESVSALDWSLARAATIVVGLLIAHSLVDYPLRTGGIMTIMSFACGLLIEPLVSAERTEDQRGAPSIRQSRSRRVESTNRPRSSPPRTAEPGEEQIPRTAQSGTREPGSESLTTRPLASQLPKSTKSAKSLGELQA